MERSLNYLTITTASIGLVTTTKLERQMETTEAKARNEKINDLRRVLLKETKPGKDGPKACTVCGKPNTRNHKALTGPHNDAQLNGYPSSWRQLTKALEQNLDFTTREKFNAQLVFLIDKLLLAREEHDNFEPTTTNNGVSNKSQVAACLTETLALLGYDLPTPPRVTVKLKDKDGKETGETKQEDGEWTVLEIAEMLKLVISKSKEQTTEVPPEKVAENLNGTPTLL